MAVTTPQIDRTFLAPDFVLPAVDAGLITRDQARGPKGLLVMFICNHCPYVQAIIDRLARDAKEIQALGIGVIAISSNDVATYPEDSFDNMGRLADKHCFSFPYAYDELQAVAKAYDAVCTPDFFGFNADMQLQYRGRLDASGRQAAAPDVRRELLEAMRMIAATGRGPDEQTSSMGCSIKWRSV